MKIAIFGDLYGRPGREIFFEHLQSIKDEHKPNLIIVNGENLAHGRGISKRIYKEFMQAGVSLFTMGNHTWGNDQINEMFTDPKVKIIRPLNITDANGEGYKIINYNGKKLLVVNLIGKNAIIMPQKCQYKDITCPFTAVKDLIETIEYDYLVVDYHAEFTSEKVAMGHMLDGVADVVYGTHTHVPTVDSFPLPKGTLYITDVGMSGALDGVIGVKKDIIINRFIEGYTVKNEVEDNGRRQLNYIIVDITNANNRKIQRYNIVK